MPAKSKDSPVPAGRSATVKKDLSAATSQKQTRAVAAKKNDSTTTKRREVTVPKYPALDQLQRKFWKAFEEVNAASPGAKLAVRSVRNLVSNVLADQLFWEILVYTVRKKAKESNDEIKADNRIRWCNHLTRAFTSPTMSNGFLAMVDDLYDTAVNIDSGPVTKVLGVANDEINNGEVVNFLDITKEVVDVLKLDPNLAHHVFNALKDMIDIGGSVKINDFLAKNIAKVSKSIDTIQKKTPLRSDSRKRLSSQKSFNKQQDSSDQSD